MSLFAGRTDSAFVENVGKLYRLKARSAGLLSKKGAVELDPTEKMAQEIASEAMFMFAELKGQPIKSWALEKQACAQEKTRNDPDNYHQNDDVTDEDMQLYFKSGLMLRIGSVDRQTWEIRRPLSDLSRYHFLVDAANYEIKHTLAALALLQFPLLTLSLQELIAAAADPQAALAARGADAARLDGFTDTEIRAALVTVDAAVARHPYVAEFLQVAAADGAALAAFVAKHHKAALARQVDYARVCRAFFDRCEGARDRQAFVEGILTTFDAEILRQGVPRLLSAREIIEGHKYEGQASFFKPYSMLQPLLAVLAAEEY